MKIAVLSGKGGTGKTFISVNLACVAEHAAYVDCDVEEPNGHLFLKPMIEETKPVMVAVPEADMEKCTGCRECVDFCRYNALALIPDRLLIFSEVCHACGGCILFCPEHALRAKPRAIGTIETGSSRQVTVLTGCLNTGEVSGVPIIKGLMGKMPREGTVLIDCPPGSACSVLESVRDADYCVLVAEPSMFGAHNLAMVHDIVKLFGKRYGVVLNKCMPGENPSQKYCEENQIPVLAEIPYDAQLGELNSEGLVAARESGKYRLMFEGLLGRIEREART